MNLIRATKDDIADIERLLYQVHKVHSDCRPDLFIPGLKKYSKEQIEQILLDDSTPIYVYKENGVLLGYAFIIYMTPSADSLVKIKTMYVDDLCVDANIKHHGIGSKIFKDLEVIAKNENCYNMLLNVYDFNTPAKAFYLKCGMKPLKTYMEKLVDQKSR